MTKNTPIVRGRPKGRSIDRRSFGPLGDLIRKSRFEKGLGLADVAKACKCSVQFISNIEHGRAPLPWEKVDLLAKCLDVIPEVVRAANLAMRADFQEFMGAKSKPEVTAASSAATVALGARDGELQQIITAYQLASMSSRKKFVKEAMKILSSVSAH